jgi:hypothetical protein
MHCTRFVVCVCAAIGLVGVARAARPQEVGGLAVERPVNAATATAAAAGGEPAPAVQASGATAAGTSDVSDAGKPAPRASVKQAGERAVPLVRAFTRRAGEVAGFGAGQTGPAGAMTTLDVSADAYRTLARAPQRVRLPVPLPDGGELVLDLQRTAVTGPQTRFVRATRAGEWELAAPRVQLWRGQVEGDPPSTALLAFTPRGAGNGLIQPSSGEPITLSPLRPTGGGTLAILRVGAGVSMPEVVEPCGVGSPAEVLPEPRAALSFPESIKPQRDVQTIRVAIEADYEFVQLFDGDTTAAAAYIVHLISAVSEIYRRDLALKLRIDFVRIWTEDVEPFGADDINSLYLHWTQNEDPTPYNIVHLLSGRRDLDYGGVAFADDICREFCYGISGLLLGSFAPGPPLSDLGNWDLYVVAHEMGHNLGTFHTHDGYLPPIDECPTGAFARGTIMSYCHTLAGGLLNVDLRFHRRVQRRLLPQTLFRDCLIYDCNDNNIPDEEDIAAGTSFDLNGNEYPDECEDCDHDGVLDDAEIAAGTPDTDRNDIPDTCQEDCNQNGVLDLVETRPANTTIDRNGNNRPDECDPDCDANGVADHIDIAENPTRDLDRDGVPDVCQDCDGNGIRDWLDVEKQHFIYIADGSGMVIEYHNVSGVPTGDYGKGTLRDPQDVVIGPDFGLYVSDYARNAVFRFDVGRHGPLELPPLQAEPVEGDPASVTPGGILPPDERPVLPFIRGDSVGMQGPTGLLFLPDGRLLVASHADSRVLEFSPGGELLRVLGDAPDSGLTNPRALALGPDGLLYVADDASTIHRFDLETGRSLGLFVGPGEGGLSGPRDMLFLDDGRLLVSSFDYDSVVAYGPHGESLGNFSDLFTPTGAWGLAVNDRGNVLTVRHHGDIRILEVDVAEQRYIRSFIRGLSGLAAPTGIAVMPPSALDCDQNGRPDRCDLADHPSADANGNGRLDACE